MIRILSFFLICNVFIQQAESQSIWERHSQVFFNFSTCSLLDGNVLLGGTNGRILISSDGGKIWRRIQTASRSDLHGISFISNLHGIAVGDAGTILLTTDGGDHWESQKSGTYINLKKVQFTSPNTILACGDSGSVFKSIDGGKTWLRLQSMTETTVNALWFFDSDNGIIIGDSGLIEKTTDGGINWMRIDSKTSVELFDIKFRDQSNGIAVGEKSTILKTIDGGKSWKVYVDTNLTAIFCIQYISDNLVLLFGENGTMFRSDDAGDKWIATGISALEFGYSQTQSVVRLPSGTLISCGLPDMIMISSDSGTTWSLRSALPILQTRLDNCSFLDSNHGFLMGMDGFFARTADGGITWFYNPIPDQSEILASHFSTIDTGFVIGTYGGFVRTTDGGSSWTDDSPDLSENFTSIAFADNKNGIMSGDSSIWQTIDEGVHWSKYSLSGFDFLANSYFDRSGFGICCGENILHDSIYRGLLTTTRDGGKSWQRTLDTSFEIFKALCFLNSETGFLSTYNFTNRMGSILQTKNAGLSWERMSAPDNVEINDILFISDSVGFACGSNSTILSTHDYGLTWIREPIEQTTGSTFLKLASIGSRRVVAIGEGDIYYKNIDNSGSESVNLDGNTPDTYFYIQLYPNPTESAIRVSLYGLYSIPGEQINVFVFDILGRKVMDLSRQANSNSNGYFSQFSANLAGLSKGFYTLVMTNGQYSRSKKFVLY